MTTKIVWMCDFFFQAWNRTGSGLATLVDTSLVSIYEYIGRVASMKAIQAPVKESI